MGAIDCEKIVGPIKIRVDGQEIEADSEVVLSRKVHLLWTRSGLNKTLGCYKIRGFVVPPTETLQSLVETRKVAEIELGEGRYWPVRLLDALGTIQDASRRS